MVTARFRPRITIRDWQALVTLVALAFGDQGLRFRAQVCSEKAEFYAARARNPRDSFCGNADLAETEDRRRLQGEEHQKRQEYYAMLMRKYRRAARRPWLSVEPDPPPPDASTITFKSSADDD
jgi:hypothetical protein